MCFLDSLVSGKLLSVVTRFALPALAVAFSADGSQIACGGEEPHIRVVSTDDTSESKTLLGHDAFVRSLAFDPRGTFLVRFAASPLCSRFPC
jgi:WD40 repeat protein